MTDADRFRVAAIARQIADAPTWARLAVHERIAARSVARLAREGDDLPRAAAIARRLADSLGAVPWRECPPGAWLIVEAQARGIAHELEEAAR